LFFAGSVCASEDARDTSVVSASVKQTLEFERSGTDVPWSNPVTGNRGVIRVERTYYLNADTPCRDYIRTVDRPGAKRTVTKGTGCRMANGRWFLEEKSDPEALPASKGESASTRPRVNRSKEKAAKARPRTVRPKPLAKSERDAGDKATAKDRKSPAGGTKVTAAIPPAPPAKPKILAPTYSLPSKSEL